VAHISRSRLLGCVGNCTVVDAALRNLLDFGQHHPHAPVANIEPVRGLPQLRLVEVDETKGAKHAHDTDNDIPKVTSERHVVWRELAHPHRIHVHIHLGGSGGQPLAVLDSSTVFLVPSQFC
jgi:hypothetical protein